MSFGRGGRGLRAALVRRLFFGHVDRDLRRLFRLLLQDPGACPLLKK